METILLAEDELVLGKLVKEALERKTYKVLWAKDGQEAFELYRQHQPDLCILDVMMPTVNGFVLAGKIRGLSETVPLLFLTARSETNDVVKGFEVGGNDYLKKPFSLEELFLRIRELLRRRQQDAGSDKKPEQDVYAIGTYEFNRISQVLRCDKESFTLTHKETALLTALITHKNSLLPRRDTLLELWGDDSFFRARTMDVYIAKLRKYLKHDEKLSIVNIRGFGYKLIDEH